MLQWVGKETHMPSTEYIESILSVTGQPFVNILGNRFMCCGYGASEACTRLTLNNDFVMFKKH